MEEQIELVRLSCGHGCYSNVTSQHARNNLQHLKIPEIKRGGSCDVLKGRGGAVRDGKFNCTTSKEGKMCDCLIEWKGRLSLSTCPMAAVVIQI
jgi:hypothetical protein